MNAHEKTRLQCPNCGEAISTLVKHAGKRGKCPACGKVIAVPVQDQTTHDSAAITEIDRLHGSREDDAVNIDDPYRTILSSGGFTCPKCHAPLPIGTDGGEMPPPESMKHQSRLTGQFVRCIRCSARTNMWDIWDGQCESADVHAIASKLNGDVVETDETKRAAVALVRQLREAFMASEQIPAAERLANSTTPLKQRVTSLARQLTDGGNYTDEFYLQRGGPRLLWRLSRENSPCLETLLFFSNGLDAKPTAWLALYQAFVALLSPFFENALQGIQHKAFSMNQLADALREELSAWPSSPSARFSVPRIQVESVLPRRPVKQPKTDKNMIEIKHSKSGQVLHRVEAASLENVELRGAQLQWACLSEKNLSFAKLPFSDLSNADLRRANLNLADMSHSVARGADFSDANLDGASFNDSDLSSAVFVGARLMGAFLAGGNYSHAVFRDANMAGAFVVGANFSGADLSGVSLEGAEYDETTRWPAGFDPERAGAKVQTEEDHNKKMEELFGKSAAKSKPGSASGESNSGRFAAAALVVMMVGVAIVVALVWLLL